MNTVAAKEFTSQYIHEKGVKLFVLPSYKMNVRGTEFIKNLKVIYLDIK